MTELLRVQAVLEQDAALRLKVAARTSPARRRDGQVVYFSPASIAVAQELMTRGLNPERAHITEVVATAVDVLWPRQIAAESEQGPPRVGSADE